MFFKKIMPWVSSLLFFLLLQMAHKFPGQMLYWGAGALLVAIVSLLFLRRIWFKQKKEFKIFWASIFLFLIGTFLIFVFLERPILRQGLIFLSSFLFFLEMYYASLFLRSGKEFYLGNLSVLNEIFPILAFFLLASGFFGWLVFLNKILWVFIILLFLVALHTTYNLFYNTVGRNFLFSPLWVTALLIAQLFWVLNFLSVGFVVKGSVLTLVWLVLTKNLIATQQKDKKKTSIYLLSLFILILIILILLSARWL